MRARAGFVQNSCFPASSPCRHMRIGRCHFSVLSTTSTFCIIAPWWQMQPLCNRALVSSSSDRMMVRLPSTMTVNTAPTGPVYVLNLEVWISVTHNLIAVSWALLPTSSQVRNLMTPKAELQTGPSGRDDAVGSRKRPSFYISRVGFWHRRTPLVHA